MENKTAIQQLEAHAMAYRARKAKVEQALESIDVYNKEQMIEDATKELVEFTSNLQKKFVSQLHYDIFTNVPTGVLKRDEVRKHAIKSAIVSSIGAMVKWDVGLALEIAADIAEDVNAHPESAKIRGMVA